MIIMFAHATILILACYMLWKKGDYQNYWAAICITGQYTSLLAVFYAVPDGLTAFAAIYGIAAFGFMNFSQTYVGRTLGILSGVMGILCIFAAWGWLPSEQGQGVWGVNVYNWTGWIEATQTLIIMITAANNDTARLY
ncbi:MAG: hypothetical protein GY761_03175 [Hyphomicrobiales bacterium]|nr:hypothetical protein [Hyphomicrobiales bacterium]